jgi:hypothetical protein
LNADDHLGAGVFEAAILRVSFGNILGEHEPLSGWLREIPESLNCCTGEAGVRALLHGLQAFAFTPKEAIKAVR